MVTDECWGEQETVGTHWTHWTQVKNLNCCQPGLVSSHRGAHSPLWPGILIIIRLSLCSAQHYLIINICHQPYPDLYPDLFHILIQVNAEFLACIFYFCLKMYCEGGWWVKSSSWDDRFYLSHLMCLFSNSWYISHVSRSQVEESVQLSQSYHPAFIENTFLVKSVHKSECNGQMFGCHNIHTIHSSRSTK